MRTETQGKALELERAFEHFARTYGLTYEKRIDGDGDTHLEVGIYFKVKVEEVEHEKD